MIAPVPAHRGAQLERWLLQRPEENTLALALLAEEGAGAFLACAVDGALVGAAYAPEGGRAVVCSLSDPGSGRALGEALRERGVRSVEGPRNMLLHLSLGLGAAGQAWECELLTATADTMGPYVHPGLLTAAPAHHAALLPLTAAYFDDLGLSPPPEGVAAFLEERIAQGRTRALLEGDRPLFRGDLAQLGPHGAVAGLLYTAPEARRRGLGTECLGQIARSTLARLPRLALIAPNALPHVGRMARKVGFAFTGAWRQLEMGN